MNVTRALEITYSLLRVVVGWMFFQAGSVKLFGWFGGMPAGNPFHLVSQIGLGAVLEVFGGLAIMLGLFTRPVAFILSGEMAVAYWQFHAPRGGWPLQNQGQPAVLYCFIFLYMAARGGGVWSVDAWLRRRRPAAVAASPPSSPPAAA